MRPYKKFDPILLSCRSRRGEEDEKKTREGNLRHEFVPLFAELFLGYFL